MCTINSQKIIVASKCTQQTTVKISYHLNMYNVLYKNDKLARPILVKIVNPIEKCQTIDFIFFQLHPSAIILYKNFHGNMLLIFIPTNFLRKHHLLIDKQKDPTSISLLQFYYFFQLEHVNTRLAKLESQFYHLPSSSYVIYKIETILKALILLNLILQKNTLNSRFHIFIKQYTSR